MNIKHLSLSEIFDSRGEPTIEVILVPTEGLPAYASVPSGKSRGKREAAVLDIDHARAAIGAIGHAVRNKYFASIADLDRFLVSLDGTPTKQHLGGNVLLGISIAAARAFAAEQGRPAWRYLNDAFFSPRDLDARPAIFSNLINGGAHAKNSLSIQEYIVIARHEGSYAATIQRLISLYWALGKRITERIGLERLPIGDEGGYAVDFKANDEPIKLLGKLLSEAKLHDWSLGLDAAATNFCANGMYNFGGEKITARELVKIYGEYVHDNPLLVSIEDPLAEDDEKGFALARRELPKTLIIGDDLTTTNPETIRRAADKLITGVIIKPNQIGTVTEACEAINVAKGHNLKVVASHRSGETSDTFIIHLARACGAYGVKIGAPVRERIDKFDELIEVYGG
jgi:enolase